MPRIFLRMRQAFEASDVAGAMEAQAQANQLIAVLMSVGVLAGIKAMLGWRGLPVGPPRAAEPLTSDGETTLRDFVDGLEFAVA